MRRKHRPAELGRTVSLRQVIGITLALQLAWALAVWLLVLVYSIVTGSGILPWVFMPVLFVVIIEFLILYPLVLIGALVIERVWRRSPFGGLAAIGLFAVIWGIAYDSLFGVGHTLGGLAFATLQAVVFAVAFVWLASRRSSSVHSGL